MFGAGCCCWCLSCGAFFAGSRWCFAVVVDAVVFLVVHFWLDLDVVWRWLLLLLFVLWCIFAGFRLCLALVVVAVVCVLVHFGLDLDGVWQWLLFSCSVHVLLGLDGVLVVVVVMVVSWGRHGF